jgi:hypothetical protein
MFGSLDMLSPWRQRRFGTQAAGDSLQWTEATGDPHGDIQKAFKSIMMRLVLIKMKLVVLENMNMCSFREIVRVECLGLLQPGWRLSFSSFGETELIQEREYILRIDQPT